MKVKINKKRAKFEMGVVTYLMEEIDPSYNIKFVFSPLIVPEVMSITHAQIERLKSHGIPVFSFNTREQCKNMQYIAMKYKRTEKVEMRPDQMNALYEKSKARLPLSSIFPWMFQAPAPADSSVSAASSVPAADKGGKKRTLKKRTKK